MRQSRVARFMGPGHPSEQTGLTEAAQSLSLGESEATSLNGETTPDRQGRRLSRERRELDQTGASKGEGVQVSPSPPVFPLL